MVPSHVTQFTELLEQVTQGALQVWQVRSDVWPHCPEGQLSTQEVPSQKVEESHELQVAALVEQVAQGAVQL